VKIFSLYTKNQSFLNYWTRVWSNLIFQTAESLQQPPIDKNCIDETKKSSRVTSIENDDYEGEIIEDLTREPLDLLTHSSEQLCDDLITFIKENHPDYGHCQFPGLIQNYLKMKISIFQIFQLKQKIKSTNSIWGRARITIRFGTYPDKVNLFGRTCNRIGWIY